MYAGDYNDCFELAATNAGWGIQNPIQMDANMVSTAAQLGFNTNSSSSASGSVSATIWTCPNRPTLPALSGTTWAMGYQYYGGVSAWGAIKSASPIKTASSNPAWMLAADLVLKFAITSGAIAWGDPAAAANSGFANLPAHKSNGNLPAGGNELFADGSATWIKATQMYNFYSYAGAGGRYFYFFQADIGTLAYSSFNQFPN